MLYKYILVNSNDLSHIGELPRASGKKLDLILGKPGSASFSYPMNADYAAQIVPYQTGIKVMRHNSLTLVWDCVWSGYVLPLDETVDANHMTVSCVGWLQRLAKRFVRRDKIYVAQDDGAIVADLIAEMNLTTAPDGYAVPVVAGSNPNTPTWLTWGGTQPNEGVGGATAYTTASRNKTVPKYQNVLSVIDELQNIENGGDIVVDPLTRAVTWHRRYRRVKDDVVFGFQWGPNNIRNFGRNIDADSQVNYVLVTGAAGTVPQYAENKAQQALIGLIEEQSSISDMRDAGMMLAYAGAEIIVRANGRITYNVTPFSSGNPNSNVPEPFIAYRIGDQGRLTAVHPPRVNIRGQAVRVFGLSLTIDDNGYAQLGALQVAP